MRVSIVVATDLDGVIGRQNKLPWHLPADLQRFKAVTMGKPMIMGRKTWDSIGRSLPGRRSIVLTQSTQFAAPGAEPAHTIEEALALAAPSEEVMVIGGAEIYRALLPHATRLYWTEVQARVGGDVSFPEFDRAVWREVTRVERPADEHNAYAMNFRVLERAGVPAT